MVVVQRESWIVEVPQFNLDSVREREADIEVPSVSVIHVLPQGLVVIVSPNSEFTFMGPELSSVVLQVRAVSTIVMAFALSFSVDPSALCRYTFLPGPFVSDIVFSFR